MKCDGILIIVKKNRIGMLKLLWQGPYRLKIKNTGERDLEFGKEGGERGLVLGEEEGERDWNFEKKGIRQDWCGDCQLISGFSNCHLSIFHFGGQRTKYLLFEYFLT